jgi:Cdc6-like AAA superfamily ATPase
MILEKKNKLTLSLPRVLADAKLSPRVKHPLPSSSGFGLAIVGSAGSGKTSTLVSLIKSKDGYRKRFHNIITVIPESSLNSLQSNPFKDLDASNRYETLDMETLSEIIEKVEANKEEGEITLLILDDVSAELQDPLILKKLMRLFLNRRHLGLSIIAIAHSLQGKGSLPYTVRKNMSHLILFRQSSGMDQLNHEILHLKKDKFSELMNYVYDKPHNHLMIKFNTLDLYKNFNTLQLQ